MTDHGYREGRNLVIERRYAGGDLDRLPGLAADLVGANVDVIVAEGTPAALAAKRVTTKIPIVMLGVGDPVGSGLVTSLARPGGNVTGMSALHSSLDGKKVELLREFKPGARRMAYLGNNRIVAEKIGFEGVQAAAKALGMDAIFVDVPLPAAFDAAFAMLATAKVDVALVPPAPPNTDARRQIAASAARCLLPTIYGERAFAEAGGLISYGPDRVSVFARAARFVDRIFNGALPADLPVQQPPKFELVINLAAARALGLTVPRSLLARADEVIE